MYTCISIHLFNRSAQAARAGCVRLWVRRRTHKVQEAMQAYIQEGFENEAEKE